MVKRKVVWSIISEIQLLEILEYFIERNKSSLYSRKLYKKFKLELNKVALNPEIGIKTRLEQIRGLIIGEYISSFTKYLWIELLFLKFRIVEKTRKNLIFLDKNNYFNTWCS